MDEKNCLLLLPCLLIFCILTGCAKIRADKYILNSETTKAADIDEKEAVLIYQIWSDEESYLKKVVAAFTEKHPKIQVLINVAPADEYDDIIMILLSSGADIDVLGMRGEQQMFRYAGTGSLADLAGMITKNGFDVTFFGPAFPRLEYNGKHYGLPYRNSCWFLIYNKDIFDRQGVEYPGQMTWDDYSELAKKLTHGEGQNKVYGGYMVPWTKNFIAIQKGYTLLDDDTTALWESIEFIEKLYNRDGSHMSLAEQHAVNANWIEEFESGRVAIMPNGDWFIGMIMVDEEQGKSDVRWDLAPLPVPEGVEPGTSFGHYTLLGITESCRKKEAAFAFASFLCGEEGSMILARNGIFPAYNTTAIKEIYIENAGKESARFLFEARIIQEQPIHPLAAEAASAFDEEAELYILGKKALEEAKNDFEKRRADIFLPNP